MWDSRQVLYVIEKYSEALELLDSYDHQTMTRPKGNASTYEISYEECKEVISQMRFGAESRPDEMEMMITVIMNCLK